MTDTTEGANMTDERDDERVRKYAEAIETKAMLRGVPDFEWDDALSAARAVLAVADAEQAELREDVTASGILLDRQSALLTGVANALRGRPPEMTHWSHHDLPQRAADLAAYAQHEADSTADALARAEAAEAKVERVTALATELDTLAEPYSTGSMFFDDAPTTRLRARASIRRDVATAIRFALDGDA